jgi:hypothetical protein
VSAKGVISASVPCVTGDGEILGDIVMVAHSIRKERTGIHSAVSIRWGRNQLEGDLFNIERNEERRKLAAGSWKLLPIEAKAVFSNEKMKAELDLFCEGLWEAHIGRIEVENLSPDPNRRPLRMLGPYTVDHGGTIIFGQPGATKTWIAMLVAQTINSGSNAVWEKVSRSHPVLFINLERDKTYFEERLAQINLTLGLPETYPMQSIHRRGASLKDVEHAAERFVQENGTEIVFLDSISRAGAGDILQQHVANEVMDTMNRICPTWVAIAHAPKPQKDGGPATVLGAQSFGAAADLTVNVTSDVYPDRIVSHLAIGKSNIKLSGKLPSILLDMSSGKLTSARLVEEPEWQVS